LTRPLTTEDRKMEPDRWSPRDTRTTAFLTLGDSKKAIEDFVREHLTGNKWSTLSKLSDWGRLGG